jgi:hypothetical protein
MFFVFWVDFVKNNLFIIEIGDGVQVQDKETFRPLLKVIIFTSL